MVAACAASGGVGSIISPLLQLLRSHIGTLSPFTALQRLGPESVGQPTLADVTARVVHDPKPKFISLASCIERRPINRTQITAHTFSPRKPQMMRRSWTGL
jgi:hypothetical protein